MEVEKPTAGILSENPEYEAVAAERAAIVKANGSLDHLLTPPDPIKEPA